MMQAQIKTEEPSLPSKLVATKGRLLSRDAYIGEQLSSAEKGATRLCVILRSAVMANDPSQCMHIVSVIHTLQALLIVFKILLA